MVKRIIFCDYDGVLNDIPYLQALPNSHKTYEELDPKRLSLLKNLCSLTQAKVVLTSLWRDDMQTLKYLKTHWQIPIIGKTPHNRGNRGREIHQWIFNSKFEGDYIILDDESLELTTTQRKNLIYTREAGYGFAKLGLEPKHLDFALGLFNHKSKTTLANTTFINAILENIENDLLRVMWNINQKEYDDENPFRNTGNVDGFKTETFEVHAYDWTWDYDDSNPRPQPVNFKWRDLEITWYKYCGRGICTNRPTTHDELAIMLDECLSSLSKWENTHDED